MNTADLTGNVLPDVPATDAAVIYEVTLDIQRRTARRFDAWLKLHLRDMLKLPGFLDARLLPPDQIAPGVDAGSVRRVVQYRLASRADLANYFSQHAARMRAESTRYFGQCLRSSRRILDAGGRELSLDQDTAAALAQPLLRCMNCNALLTGKYCAECGQPSHTYSAPLWADIQDFFGNHFGFDTKLFRSVMPLLFRPGFLSREYSAGRRVRYINPLRLYIFSSILFFLVAWSTTSPSSFHFNEKPTPTVKTIQASKPLTPAEQREIRDNPYLSESQKQTILNAMAGSPAAASHAAKASVSKTEVTAAPSLSQNDTLTGSDDTGNMVNGTFFGHKINMTQNELKTRVISAMESYLPKLMFVFLPLVALLLKIFYLRSGRYYMEHLIFALHNHAFIFVTMLVMVLAHLLGQHVSWMTAPAHYLNVILGWYIVIYVFLAMLFYYRQGFFKTLLKYLLIGCIYWIALVGVFVGGMMLIITYVVAS
ncbi:MAG: DUF4286 family protein [Gammaproteobacteria bacterium]|nr:DUF4286 family protein [Gammaproteobacteria bacterium]